MNVVAAQAIDRFAGQLAPPETRLTKFGSLQIGVWQHDSVAWWNFSRVRDWVCHSREEPEESLLRAGSLAWPLVRFASASRNFGRPFRTNFTGRWGAVGRNDSIVVNHNNPADSYDYTVSSDVSDDSST
jgi:hypothetical protein